MNQKSKIIRVMLAVATLMPSYKSFAATQPAGEDIYSAIFFQAGSKFDSIKHIISPDAAGGDHAHLTDQQKAIVRTIRTQKPAFFSQFGSDMQSGHPERVRAAFDAAAKATQSAMKQLANDQGAVQLAGGAGYTSTMTLVMTVTVTVTITVTSITLMLSRGRHQTDINEVSLARDQLIMDFANAFADRTMAI